MNNKQNHENNQIKEYSNKRNTSCFFFGKNTATTCDDLTSLSPIIHIILYILPFRPTDVEINKREKEESPLIIVFFFASDII